MLGKHNYPMAMAVVCVRVFTGRDLSKDGGAT